MLEPARMIFEATGDFIINPRDVDTRSLLLMDSEWVNDFARYLSEVAYQKRLLKGK